MIGFIIFVGFMISGFIGSSIAQLLTNVQSASDELGILAWGFAGGIVGIVLADLLLQTL